MRTAWRPRRPRGLPAGILLFSAVGLLVTPSRHQTVFAGVCLATIAVAAVFSQLPE